MKKILTVTLLFFSLITLKSNAQTGLVCNVLDKIEDGSLERKLDFKLAYSGFKSVSETKEFCSKMSKANTSIQSVECTGTDGKGNYFIDFKMNKAESFQFYKGLFIKYGFSHFIINGEKKEIQTMN